MFEFVISEQELYREFLKKGNYKFLVANSCGIPVTITNLRRNSYTIYEGESIAMDFSEYTSEQIISLIYRGFLTLVKIQK